MKKTLEQFKSMSRKNKIILVSILTGIILIFGATTFAYFSIAINGESQPLSVQAGTLILEFNDEKGSTIREESINLDNKIEKDMVITNTGTLDATATIMWNELTNTYLDKSLKYTIKQTIEYNNDDVVNTDTLEYNVEVPEAGIYVPRSEEPKKTALTRGLFLPAGKKIYYRVTITYNHLDDVDQTTDLEAKLSTSFTIEEGEQLELFTITPSNRNLIGYKGTENEELVIPARYQDENGKWYKVVGITRTGRRGAFMGCTNLKSVTISEGITTIDTFAFRGCSNLISITIPDSVTSIGDSALYGCSNLTSITIPSSVTNIGKDVFRNCKNLVSINVDENNLKYESVNDALIEKDGKILIQYAVAKSNNSYIMSADITSIGDYAFSNCSSLTSITIPDGVTSIGKSAFSGCNKLLSIEIPDSVINMEDYVFNGCSNLTTATIGNSVMKIGRQAFSSCSNLTSITIGNNVNSIGVNAFYECTKLTSITIPDGVTTLEDQAFYRCFDLAIITMGKSVTSIGSNAFGDCKLKSINVNEDNQTYKSLDGVLFTKDLNTLVMYPTEKRGNYSIPEGVVNIKSKAFQNSFLTSVTIPDSTSNIESDAFLYCKLESININENNQTYKSIDGIVFTKDEKNLLICPGNKSGSYIIPDSVTNIADHAFYFCNWLSSITIPSSVTSIGICAFNYCRLRSITIPNSVINIGNGAFIGCEYLDSITYKDITYTSKSAFTNVFKATTGNTIGRDVFNGTKLTE